MFKVPNQFRIGQAIKPTTPLLKNFAHLSTTNDAGLNGVFAIPRRNMKAGFYFLAYATSGADWDHVSISIPAENRCPTWEEMCYIKSLFWDDDAAVMQLHPPKKDWVSNHPYCLHLWRPQKADIPLPPSTMVGLKDFNTRENKTF